MKHVESARIYCSTLHPKKVTTYKYNFEKEMLMAGPSLDEWLGE